MSGAVRVIRRVAAIILFLTTVTFALAAVGARDDTAAMATGAVLALIALGGGLALWPRRAAAIATVTGEKMPEKDDGREYVEIGGVSVDVDDLGALTDTLAEIVDDGVIDPDEQEEIDQLIAALNLSSADQEKVFAAIIGGMIEDAAADDVITETEEGWVRAALVALNVKLDGPLEKLFDIACMERAAAAEAAKAVQAKRRARPKSRRRPVPISDGVNVHSETAAIAFDYVNAQGDARRRVVDVYTIRPDKAGAVEITGACEIAGGFRCFKLARMGAVTDAATGEVFDDPRDWARAAARSAGAGNTLHKALS